MSSSQSISVLERYLFSALEGDRAAARSFFETFLNTALYVPERRQAQKMSDQAEYPNEFLNILGIQDKERVLVPVFSRQEMIQEWCGSELAFRSMKGDELLKLIPEEWWICVNPAAEVEKELSPWEIDQLKEGVAGIPAVIDEIYQELIIEPLEIQVVQTSEYPALQSELRNFAAANPDIEKMYLIRQTGKDADEKVIKKILLGLEISAGAQAKLDALKDEVQNLADRCQVGDDKVAVFSTVSGEGDMSFGLFGRSEPFYVNSAGAKPNSFLKKLFGPKN